MIGDKLKALREAKCWSQAHLADAARLNIRTVQRIEAGDPASDETMLSLAAALDVDVTELDGEVRRGRATRGSSAAKVTLAGLLIGPAALFLLVNLARSAGGIGGPYDALAVAGGKVMTFQTFNLVSPVIFLGGPAIALMLCLPALIRLRTAKMGRGVLSINAVEVRTNWAAAAIAALALLSGAALLAYAAVEALRTPAS